MWSRKQSTCSAVSGASRGDDDLTSLQLYPFAVALRVRVLQIVCGISGLVVGAVGWLEERRQPALGLGVPTGAVTVLAAATSVYYSRGFGGWTAAHAGSRRWGAPWRALGPSPCAAVPLTVLWVSALTAHVAMVVVSLRSLLNIGSCISTTCCGVAGAQLAVSGATLASAAYMLQLDLRFDAALCPPSHDTHTHTAVSMVPLTSIALNSGSGDGTSEPLASPPANEKAAQPSPEPPT